MIFALFAILLNGAVAFVARPPALTPLHSHISSHAPLYSSASGEETQRGFDVFNDETDETLLRINFSYPQTSPDSVALDAVRRYTKSFPFAAVLPVQPLTYLPVQMPDGEMALRVTFLRKKTEEKDSGDGGILFHCQLASKDATDDGDLIDDDRKSINLVAKRISKGQTVSKVFSEKQIIMAFVKGLSEAKGAEILRDGGDVQVDSVFHLWM
jgi:hypothetical protein